MKVKEFIKELLEYDQNTDIVVKQEYEGLPVLEWPATSEQRKGDLTPRFVQQADKKVVVIE